MNSGTYTVELGFYDPGFCSLLIYALFALSWPNAYYTKTLTDFTFPQFHVFPEFPLHFSSPDYENLPDFTFYSSVLRISYSRQQTSFPVSSRK
jgi:hypothetical protein